MGYRCVLSMCELQMWSERVWVEGMWDEEVRVIDVSLGSTSYRCGLREFGL